MSKNHEARTGSTGENGPGIGKLKRLGLVTLVATGGILSGCSAGAEGPCQQPPAVTAEVKPPNNNQLSPKEYERVNRITAGQLMSRLEGMREELPEGDPTGKKLPHVTLWQNPEDPSNYTSLWTKDNSLTISYHEKKPAETEGVTRSTTYETGFKVTPLPKGNQLEFINGKREVCTDATGEIANCSRFEWKTEVKLNIPTDETIHENLTPEDVAEIINNKDMRLESIVETHQDGETYTYRKITIDENGNIRTEGVGAPGAEDPKKYLAETIEGIS